MAYYCPISKFIFTSKAYIFIATLFHFLYLNISDINRKFEKSKVIQYSSWQLQDIGRLTSNLANRIAISLECIGRWRIKNVSSSQACQGRTRRLCSFGICGRCHMARPARICIRSSSRRDNVGQFRGRLEINLVISIANKLNSFAMLYHRSIVSAILRNKFSFFFFFSEL